MLLDEYRGFGLADPATRDTPDQIFDFSSVGVEPARVQTEKGEQDHEPDALVPVHEGAISHDCPAHAAMTRIHETKVYWASEILVARLEGWKSQKT